MRLSEPLCEIAQVGNIGVEREALIHRYGIDVLDDLEHLESLNLISSSGFPYWAKPKYVAHTERGRYSRYCLTTFRRAT